jgi:hypothetical protein
MPDLMSWAMHGVETRIGIPWGGPGSVFMSSDKSIGNRIREDLK